MLLAFIASNDITTSLTAKNVYDVYKRKYTTIVTIESRLKNYALPVAIRIKNATAVEISSHRVQLDSQHYRFPPVLKESSCSFCQVENCMKTDCINLETVIQCINATISSMPELSCDINRIIKELDLIHDWMNCTRLTQGCGLPHQSKDDNYINAKDTVQFLEVLLNKYSALLYV